MPRRICALNHKAGKWYTNKQWFPMASIWCRILSIPGSKNCENKTSILSTFDCLQGCARCRGAKQVATGPPQTPNSELRLAWEAQSKSCRRSFSRALPRRPCAQHLRHQPRTIHFLSGFAGEKSALFVHLLKIAQEKSEKWNLPYFVFLKNTKSRTSESEPKPCLKILL